MQSGFALDESSDISLCFSLCLLSVFLVSEVLGRTSVASFAHVNWDHFFSLICKMFILTGIARQVFLEYIVI